MADPSKLAPSRRMPQRTRSNFLARTATDDAAQLDRRSSVLISDDAAGDDAQADERHSGQTSDNPYEPLTNDSPPTPRKHELSRSIFDSIHSFGSKDNKGTDSDRQQSSSRRHLLPHGQLGEDSLTAQMHQSRDSKRSDEESWKPKVGSLPRPVGGHGKLGTFSGVFVPTSLNVLSILMFLRFGFILGQTGVLGMMGMLIASYLINLVTTLSISAIATNGTVRGGGAYYLISRSLGPEFGGSIGIVLYLGFVFNTGMNAVGLIDCVKQNFGSNHGDWAQWLPEGHWWEYLWATVVLIICTGICLAGSGLFARCSNGLLAILLVATFSIPFSAFIMKPFESHRLGIEYTGLSAKTFMENLKPRFTRGADGSQMKGKENYQDLFGILFPATGGIFAGASMSGDLKHPSKAIPKGTLSGLLLTFLAYALVILAMAATITRESLYNDVNVIQDTNISGILVLLGEFATTFFSSLMGVIGSAKLLQALARDDLIPGFSIFGQGTQKSDEPTYAIIITYIVAQLTMLFDINQIASFVTMTYLMTFLVTNLACFLLKVSSAPNFRPSFHFFNWWTAAAGTIISGATMFFVDGLYASGCVGILIVIFLIIHYTSPPKSWGDVSQSLIYHQVRKYLLRLRQEHVKFWRPQILLFINDPRHQYRLIQFCNSLKKGGLFVLGHVIVSSDFGEAVPEARRQQAAWRKYIDVSKVKAFVNIAISPMVEWGTRNVVLSTGLGGMRPNIVVMGFYNLNEFRRLQPLVDVPSPQPSRSSSSEHGGHQSSIHDHKSQEQQDEDDKLLGLLPTDTCRTEGAVKATSYVTILEDLLLRVQINVAIAKGFNQLELPHPKGKNAKKYIDLWPIQMSAEIAAEGGEHKQNVLTTNFDTYTLILQLGCILNTVPRWKKAYKLRVAVFVEYESDVEEERGRVKTLLGNLRIEAEVLVFWLASGDLKSYEIIVNGSGKDYYAEAEKEIDEVLKDEEWWRDVQKLRGRHTELTPSEELEGFEGLLSNAPQWPSSSFQHGRRDEKLERFAGLRKMLRHKRRKSLIGLNVNMGMRTHRLDPDLVEHHRSHDSASEDSSSSDDEDTVGADDREDEAASENDADELEYIGNREESVGPSTFSGLTRRKSDGESMVAHSRSRGSLFQRAAHAFSIPSLPRIQKRSDEAETPGLESAAASSTSMISQTPKDSDDTPSHLIRHSSIPKFSSSPVPETVVNEDERPGPSIMFTDEPSPSTEHYQSIYSRESSTPGDARPSKPAGGFPSQRAVPLRFNDLPCRAQHLILNELIRQQSQDTAVVFTTLPSPVEGSCKSEADSVSYLSDLEVLCQGLPPALLVHSNSMTVTMNL
ncbi:MAG: hypothetical protein M1819_001155 [Sarea resinae]|nr:MAG: hypothetical protein M1819_001155 [Sarea resinae]